MSEAVGLLERVGARLPGDDEPAERELEDEPPSDRAPPDPLPVLREGEREADDADETDETPETLQESLLGERAPPERDVTEKPRG